MLRALSPEEELKSRRQSFAKLKRGTLFDLAQERFFIAAKKIDKKAWEVIELTDANKQRIISGEACDHSRLHFDEMSCLNLR
jgi:hypothetical protein